jgi:DAK2 domain fusion protein YloV
MGVLEALDASAVRRWSAAAVDLLTVHRQEIDDLNVYPVPDGDTGTNLVLTMTSAFDALRADRAAVDAASAIGLMARGAVLGARGNSGVIASQILRGIAEVLTSGAAPNADGPALRAALSRAAELAWSAVAEPVEGTMLSVASGAARAAAAVRSDSLAEVIRAAARGASEALAETPRQLPVLAQAGVVDAGGRGLVVLLDSLAGVITGDAAPSPGPRRVGRDRRALEATRERGSPEYEYEVQYLLGAEEAAVATLREELARLGDSLVVVGTGEGLWNVHVHVNDIGAAIEAGVQAGRPNRITVTRFADQNDEVPAAQAGRRWADGAGTAAALATARGPAAGQGGPALGRGGVPRSGVAVVAVAPGEGVADLFEAEGVVVVDGGPTRNPSTAEVLAAIEESAAAAVVVLPNSAATTGVANAAAEEARAAGIEVAVVPTRSPVQGLAAVAVHDESRWFGDDVIAMAEAAAATRWGEITVAVRDALTMAGPCRAGDVLGMADGDVVLIGRSVAEVARELIDRLLTASGELVTLVVGTDAEEGLGALVERHVAATHPAVEVTVYYGGQPHYPLLLGVE